MAVAEVLEVAVGAGAGAVARFTACEPMDGMKESGHSSCSIVSSETLSPANSWIIESEHATLRSQYRGTFDKGKGRLFSPGLLIAQLANRRAEHQWQETTFSSEAGGGAGGCRIRYYSAGFRIRYYSAGIPIR